MANKSLGWWLCRVKRQLQGVDNMVSCQRKGAGVTEWKTQCVILRVSLTVACRETNKQVEPEPRAGMCANIEGVEMLCKSPTLTYVTLGKSLASLSAHHPIKAEIINLELRVRKLLM